MPQLYTFFIFFFNDPATTEIYTLSLHDALPILRLVINEVDFTDTTVAGSGLDAGITSGNQTQYRAHTGATNALRLFRRSSSSERCFYVAVNHPGNRAGRISTATQQNHGGEQCNHFFHRAIPSCYSSVSCVWPRIIRRAEQACKQHSTS